MFLLFFEESEMDNGCRICFDHAPPLFSTGCACRGTSAAGVTTPYSSHVECACMEITTRIERTNEGSVDALRSCFVCKQNFTGHFALLLARRLLDGARPLPIGSRVPAHGSFIVVARISYAAALLSSGMYADCERELRIAAKDGGDPMTIDSQLAVCMTKTGRLAAAEILQRTSLARSRELYGDSHISTVSIAHNLSATLSLLGRTAEALDLLRLVYETEKATIGANHSTTLETGAMLGAILVETGAYADAVAVLSPVYDGMMRVFGDSAGTHVVAAHLGDALYQVRAFEEAERVQAWLCAALDTGRGARTAKLKLQVTRACMTGSPAGALELLRELHTAHASAPFNRGVVVVVRGLVRSTQYNGTTAVVAAFDGTRYDLTLQSGKLIRVRADCVFPSVNQ